MLENFDGFQRKRNNDQDIVDEESIVSNLASFSIDAEDSDQSGEDDRKKDPDFDFAKVMDKNRDDIDSSNEEETNVGQVQYVLTAVKP